jgi:hypothetical protein
VLLEAKSVVGKHVGGKLAGDCVDAEDVAVRTGGFPTGRLEMSSATKVRQVIHSLVKGKVTSPPEGRKMVEQRDMDEFLDEWRRTTSRSDIYGCYLYGAS